MMALVLMFVDTVRSQNASKEIFSIFERFSTYSTVIFTGILGVYEFKVFKN